MTLAHDDDVIKTFPVGSSRSASPHIRSAKATEECAGPQSAGAEEIGSTSLKPYVICRMAASVDGRILPSRWRPRSFSSGDVFERLHRELGCEAWLVGRVEQRTNCNILPTIGLDSSPISRSSKRPGGTERIVAEHVSDAML
jgi:hypothetical protein